MSDLQKNCEQVQQQLEEFALGELADREAAEIAEHLLTGCAMCNLRLREVMDEWASAGQLVRPQLPPVQIERDLMARVRGEVTPLERVARAAEPARGKVRTPDTGRWIAGFALAASLCGVATWVAWNRGGEPNVGNDLAGAEAYRAELSRRAEAAERTGHWSSIPQLDFKYVGNRVPANGVHGHIVSDDLAKQWHVYAFDMPPLASGRRYVLWLVSENGEFTSEGTLEAQADGTASKLIDVPADRSSYVAIAISEEGPEDAARPTGDAFMRADLPR